MKTFVLDDNFIPFNKIKFKKITAKEDIEFVPLLPGNTIAREIKIDINSRTSNNIKIIKK